MWGDPTVDAHDADDADDGDHGDDDHDGALRGVIPLGGGLTFDARGADNGGYTGESDDGALGWDIPSWDDPMFDARDANGDAVGDGGDIIGDIVYVPTDGSSGASEVCFVVFVGDELFSGRDGHVEGMGRRDSCGF